MLLIDERLGNKGLVMKKPDLPLLLAVFLSLGVSRISASEATAAHETFRGAMTLDQAVGIALRQNTDVLRAIQQIQLTRGQVIQVRGQALPQVGLNSSYAQKEHSLVGGQGLSGSIDPRSWEVNIQATQVVYSGGQVGAAIKIAKFSNDSSYFSLRDTIDNTIAKVRQNFYNVLLDAELITVQEQSVKLLTSQLKDQENRFAAGTVPAFNVLQAKVALANEQPVLIRAKGTYDLALVELSKTLGLDPGANGKPTFTAKGELTVSERGFGLKSAIDLALKQRPFLKVQRLAILSQKEQIKVAFAGYLPKVNANIGETVRNSVVSNQMDNLINGWFFGFTGNWAIFDGLETYGAVKAARASLEQAKIQYDASVQQVEMEVQQAYVKLQTARATIESGRMTVTLAEESLRLATDRLAAGAGTQLDVLNAQTQLTVARSTELQARADYNIALADYDRVTAAATKYAETFADPLVGMKVPKMPVLKNPDQLKNPAGAPQHQ